MRLKSTSDHYINQYFSQVYDKLNETSASESETKKTFLAQETFMFLPLLILRLNNF